MKNLIQKLFAPLLLLAMVFSFVLPSFKVSAQAATGNIWGYKVKMPGNQFSQTPPSGETVTVDGGSPTTANPFNFGNLSAGSHTVAVSVPTGWSVGYTLCYNDTSCHANTPTPGNSVVINVPAGGYADLWWHYSQSGIIQGYKATTQLNDPAVNGLKVTVDGSNSQTTNPFIFNNISAGDHTLTVDLPPGWSVGYTACINQTNCHTNSPTSGNTATINVPAGGYVDFWWHFTQATGKVQGYKLDNTGNPFTNPGATITVNGQTFGPTSNPYTATLPSGNTTVQSSIPAGYDVYYSICPNCFNHPASSFVKGSQVNVDVPSGGYIDLHWKYVTPSLNSNFSLPASSLLRQILTGSLSTEIYQGYPNIYAPEVIYDNGIYKMWYGGGGIDIRDRIHYAESTDGIVWAKKGAVVEAPSSSFNANDPSVIKVNGKYYMYMTISEGDLLDKIYLSTSSDGLAWTTPTKVLDKGPYNWNSRYTARPTVIYDNGTFKMWYDTTTGTNFSDPVTDINVGYATSLDGINWQKYDQPVFKGYAANDVKKVQGVYVMLIQGAWEGTHIAMSKDGVTWIKQGTLIPPDSGVSSQILGHLTPALFLDPVTSKPKTVYMGAGISGSSIGYDRNAIYMYSLKDGELEKFLQATTTTPPNPTPTPSPFPTPVPSPTPTTPTTTPTPTSVRLINDQGTFYLINDNQKQGITNPGMLYSYGFELKDAHPAMSADLSLPSIELLLPGNGSLVKSPVDPTVWLISNGKKQGFVSEQVFLGLGFRFSSVLTVTAPELDKLSQGSLLADTTVSHLDGVDVNDKGTIYWLSGGKRYGYPSMEIYNSWHIDNDFSQVVPANSADMALPFGGTLSARVLY